MTLAITYTAITAALTTLLIWLALLRLSVRNVWGIRVLRMWLRATPIQVILVSASLVGLSALSAFKVDASLIGGQGSEPPIDRSVLGILGDAEPGNSSDAKVRALSNLRAYASKIEDKRQVLSGLDEGASSTSERSLPDVDTMIDRLAKRLANEPENKEGWTMLAWSYAQTNQYRQAIDAYKAALRIDPENADLQSGLRFVENRLNVAPPVGGNDQPATYERNQKPNAGGADEGVMVRGMVEQLAARLVSEPNDADGWIRLIRSWTVLGETELAKEALRQADAAFIADASTRGRIADAAKTVGIDDRNASGKTKNGL